MKKVTVYSDGACEGNPGPGGWAAILTYKGHRREISGGSPATTSNRMELQAAIEALKCLKESCEVEFFTDSQYVQLGISQWLAEWKGRGWKTKERNPVKNDDLWKELDAESQKHMVVWKWIKGHAGHPMNERCNFLARSEIEKLHRQYPPDRLKAMLE